MLSNTNSSQSSSPPQLQLHVWQLKQQHAQPIQQAVFPVAVSHSGDDVRHPRRADPAVAAVEENLETMEPAHTPTHELR